MTYLLKDIRDHLLGSEAIADEIADRVFPDAAEQGTEFPYFVLSEVSNTPEEGLQGEVGTHETLVDIDIWTDGTGRHAKAKELSELVRNRLSGYRGQLGEGEFCNGCHLMRGNITTNEPTSPGSDKRRRRVNMGFRILHTADVPSFT